jgi:hypothetical protein
MFTKQLESEVIINRMKVMEALQQCESNGEDET